MRANRVLAIAALCASSSCTRSGALSSDRWTGTDASIDVGSVDAGASAEPGVALHARCKERSCLIPAGSFIAGSPASEPFRGRTNEEQHQVTFTWPLVVDRYEVTQEQWVSVGFTNLAGTVDNGGGRDCTEPDCPAGVLTWFDAVAYATHRSREEGLPECIHLSNCVGTAGAGLTCQTYKQTTDSYYECRGYRLATSPEYQYFTRAGTNSAFYSGEFTNPLDTCYSLSHLDTSAWYCNNSNNRTHPVGRLQPNLWGLFDLMGNAAEFTASTPLDPDRKSAHATINPGSRLADDGYFDTYGGMFHGWPTLLRSANQGAMVAVRQPVGKATRAPGIGFRLVRSLSPEEAAAW